MFLLGIGCFLPPVLSWWLHGASVGEKNDKGKRQEKKKKKKEIHFISHGTLLDFWQAQVDRRTNQILKLNPTQLIKYMENYVSQKYFVLTEAIDFINVYRKQN